MRSPNIIDQCKCEFARSTLEDVLLVAPCPPPFFYNEFAKYASSRDLSSEPVCEVARRCMSKYPDGNSSEIIADICSSPTTTTTTTSTTTYSTFQTTPETPFTSLTTQAKSTSTNVTIPTTPTIVTEIAGCNIICVGLIVTFVLIAIAVVVVLLLMKNRGQIVIRLNQMMVFFGITCRCRRGNEDQNNLVYENCYENTVFYDSCSENVVKLTIDKTDNNLAKQKRERISVVSDGCIQARSEDVQVFFERSESDTSRDNSDTFSLDEMQVKVTKNYSETNSLITQVSDTLEMQANFEIGKNTNHARTGTSGEDEQMEETERETSKIGDHTTKTVIIAEQELSTAAVSESLC